MRRSWSPDELQRGGEEESENEGDPLCERHLRRAWEGRCVARCGTREAGVDAEGVTANCDTATAG